jgi:hypothetical protein
LATSQVVVSESSIGLSQRIAIIVLEVWLARQLLLTFSSRPLDHR